MFSFSIFIRCSLHSSFFFFNDTATTEIYTLSLHDALPISCTQTTRYASASPASAHWKIRWSKSDVRLGSAQGRAHFPTRRDRKSTRLNSSHLVISYAVFCLKKKKKNEICTVFAYVIVSNV